MIERLRVPSQRLRAPRQRLRAPRQGAILVCVLVCVGIASTIMLTSLRAGLRARRQTRQETQMEQTRWLLEAGMIRATKALRTQDNYQGETWNVGDALAAYENAEVTITVTSDGMKDDEVELFVSAEIRGSDPMSKSTRRSERVIAERSESTNEN